MTHSSSFLPVCGVIPAYKPEPKLCDLVDEVLCVVGLEHLVIVDDASGGAYAGIFAELARRPRVTVLHHAVNQGTGGGLKIAFNHILTNWPETKGIVTFDADGQHLPADVQKVVAAFCETPDKLVLGVRDFHDGAIKVPLRSKVGNRMTELIFTAFTGIYLKDTQTGLRCYSTAMARKCLTILRNRYEFQLEALLTCAREWKFCQIPIETIYEDGNRCSHFNPLIDSIRIYLVFLRFMGAVLFCTFVDYLIFSLLLWMNVTIFSGLLVARVSSVSLNFFLARNKVFQSHGDIIPQVCKFISLAVFLFTVSYYSILFLKNNFGWPPLLSKVAVETMLFFLSFLAQNLLIFADRPLGR